MSVSHRRHRPSNHSNSFDSSDRRRGTSIDSTIVDVPPSFEKNLLRATNKLLCPPVRTVASIAP